MKLILNQDDKNYIANIQDFKSQLNQFLEKYGDYAPSKVYLDVGTNSTEFNYNIKRVNLESDYENIITESKTAWEDDDYDLEEDEEEED